MQNACKYNDASGSSHDKPGDFCTPSLSRQIRSCEESNRSPENRSDNSTVKASISPTVVSVGETKVSNCRELTLVELYPEVEAVDPQERFRIRSSDNLCALRYNGVHLSQTYQSHLRSSEG